MRDADAPSSNAFRVFVGDDAVAHDRVGNVLAESRGLAYGDGLFETMRAHRGAIHWWPAHWARLAHGAKRLGIRLPSQARVEAERDALLRNAPDAVIKLMLIRGSGGRGYAPDRDAAPLWLLSAHPLPSPLFLSSPGIRLRWCETRLSAQPLLAGLKHCNRLEQVLARAEWDALAGLSDTDAGATDTGETEAAACADGLMRDEAGAVIAATSANLFIYREGDGHDHDHDHEHDAPSWYTPRLDRCGIAGICRGWALTALNAREATLSPEDVESADAVFLCNAVRGILPVVQLGLRRWSRHPALTEAQHRLAAAHPAFAGIATVDFSEVHP
jgi:4-amino-4-deoxychorismate lyase